MDILIVEDNTSTRQLLAKLSERSDASRVVSFDHPVNALEYARTHEVGIALVDYALPEMNGIELIHALKRDNHTRDIPIVMVTARKEREIRTAAIDAGATDFLLKPLEPTIIHARLRNLLALRRAHLDLQNRSEALAREVEVATQTIVDREHELVLRLARAAECRDFATGDHLDRVAHASRQIAIRLGLSSRFCNDVYWASPMHDIGKLSVPDSVLLKPGPLTPEERLVMQEHTTAGAKLLAGSGIPLLDVAARIALSHHERFDGRGYPHGIAGEKIPLEARIVAVADVFDALTSKRPYKDAWSVEEALDFLADNRGTHFDPNCVDAFLVEAPPQQQNIGITLALPTA